jgi:methionyl-tRNA formyltransferase
LDVCGEGPLVGTGCGSLRLIEVQAEGGKVMSGASYLRGHGLEIGNALR